MDGSESSCGRAAPISEKFRLRGGWTLTEATRRLFPMVRSERQRVWIDEATMDSLATRLGYELARHREIETPQLEIALDTVRSEYDLIRPRLISLDVAH